MCHQYWPFSTQHGLDVGWLGLGLNDKHLAPVGKEAATLAVSQMGATPGWFCERTSEEMASGRASSKENRLRPELPSPLPWGDRQCFHVCETCRISELDGI